jgi:hypothetical protein
MKMTTTTTTTTTMIMRTTVMDITIMLTMMIMMDCVGVGNDADPKIAVTKKKLQKVSMTVDSTSFPEQSIAQE